MKGKTKMNPFIMLSGLEGDEQEKFSKWLDQYERVSDIDVFFEEHPEVLETNEATEDVKQLEKLAQTRFDPPKPGQIRLLKRGTTKDPDAVVPILILSQWEGDRRWLAAPFSQYTKPAIPGELDTGIDFHAYRVIEAWNTFVIPEFVLYIQTVYLREAGESVRKDACAVFFSQLKGTAVPEGLASRVGPRIMYEFDPRIQYVLHEQKQFAPLRAMVADYDESFDEYEEPVFEAASGKEYLSGGFLWSGHHLIPIPQGIRAGEDFCPVQKGRRIPPHLMWSLDTLPEGCKPGMTVYLRHVNRQLLGRGILDGNEADGYEVTLQNVIPPEETPTVASPADIVLIFHDK